jgi:hypothetical protein
LPVEANPQLLDSCRSRVAAAYSNLAVGAQERWIVGS